mmetsp:Transcript_66198/g.156347  ORF Transcript_66198/g.156347 Transcript_66198/m.156347 type:complete len:86 (+) Transcript_66198:169-426(+)
MSTTPGGTKITYDRAALLQMRMSPATRSPPPGFDPVPGVMVGIEEDEAAAGQVAAVAAAEETNGKKSPRAPFQPDEDESLFEMEK